MKEQYQEIESAGDVAPIPSTQAGTQRVTFVAPEAEVLLVDDFPSNLLVAEGLLVPYKMRIFTCLNGLEALELVQARSFDLVLMDHMMPEMDGMETVAAIRALGGRFTELPVAVLTANVASGTQEHFLANGFNDFLAKPIESSALNAVLHRWIPAAKRQSVAADDGIASEYAMTRPLPKIAGVDIASGMARVNGSYSRYRKLLHMFEQDVATHFALLEASPDRASLQSFTTVVHALKSSLAYIGAHALSESAALLETAGRNGDLALIKDKLTAFREELAALTARIGEIRAVARADAASPALLREALTELQAALEAKDTDGMDTALAKLQNLQLPPKTRASADDMARLMLFGDFKKALQTVNALLERGS